MPLDLEAELDNLYGADLEEFIAERKRVATALKGEGRKAEAAWVQELRKPSLPAWTVNQLVHRRRKDVAELIEAGERLEQAQQSLVGAGDRAGFAAARKQEQAVLKRLREQAKWALGKRASDATLDRVAATLTAAAVTPEGREQLAAGRLTGEVAPAGFEAFAGTLPPAPPKPPRAHAPPAPTPTPKAGDREKPGAKEKPAARDDAAKRRREAAAAARESLKAAREREADIKVEVRKAERVAKEARNAFDAAERKAERLRDELDAAAEAVDTARRALDAAKKP